MAGTLLPNSPLSKTASQPRRDFAAEDMAKSLSQFASALYRAMWQLLRIRYYIDDLGTSKNKPKLDEFWRLGLDLLRAMAAGTSEPASPDAVLHHLRAHPNGLLRTCTRVLRSIEAAGVVVQLNPGSDDIRGRYGVTIGWNVRRFVNLLKE
jgi:hypothetical protein